VVDLWRRKKETKDRGLSNKKAIFFFDNNSQLGLRIGVNDFFINGIYK